MLWCQSNNYQKKTIFICTDSIRSHPETIWGLKVKQAMQDRVLTSQEFVYCLHIGLLPGKDWGAHLLCHTKSRCPLQQYITLKAMFYYLDALSWSNSRTTNQPTRQADSIFLLILLTEPRLWPRTPHWWNYLHHHGSLSHQILGTNRTFDTQMWPKEKEGEEVTTQKSNEGKGRAQMGCEVLLNVRRRDPNASRTWSIMDISCRW